VAYEKIKEKKKAKRKRKPELRLVQVANSRNFKGKRLV
jgi:hypothetical protein